MAGNSELRARLHRHFGDQMKYSGRDRADASRHRRPTKAGLPGAKPRWFFAPDQIRKRAKEWGPGGIEQRFGAAWSGFAPMLERWLSVVESRGPEAVQRVYLDTLQGPHSAGAGPHAVAARVKRFWRSLIQGIAFDLRGNAAKTATRSRMLDQNEGYRRLRASLARAIRARAGQA